MMQLERGRKKFWYKRLGREEVLENEDNDNALHKQKISINSDMQKIYFGLEVLWNEPYECNEKKYECHPVPQLI